jgi:hypothetical protein
LLSVIFGIFLILHGLVHLLYFGQSLRFFELAPGMVWPNGSWAFSKLLGERSVQALAGITCILAALIFVVGGAGLILQQSWWRPIVTTAAIFSCLLYLLFWNGRLHRLDNQGGVAILINLVILALLFAYQQLGWKL